MNCLYFVFCYVYNVEVFYVKYKNALYCFVQPARAKNISYPMAFRNFIQCALKSTRSNESLLRHVILKILQ